MQHMLNVNGKLIRVASGKTLVDAALTKGVLIPHDCATGQCETCRVKVAWGDVDAGGSAYGDSVLACQARVRGDATITFEEPPRPETVEGQVEEITALNDSVVELTLRTAKPLLYRPGQYAKLALSGFPAREYSYTARMNGAAEPDLAVFQIKRLPNGKVSSAIGKAITPGHRGRLTGPFGSAFLREQESGPLVLAASGTGFAPIWSLARAVTLATPKREIKIIAGGRNPSDLYMDEALRWLQDHGHCNRTIAVREGAVGTMVTGTPDEFLPPLNARSTVHVAGNPELVERVRQKAMIAQAACYADPFLPSANTLGWRDTIRNRLFPA